mmetsp:Transcript_40505/g.60026  ORF Transcript_40505/g.60026 Transcript_40505/m.60026 type:complete len:570 (-) Transcript_40505:204-1913(-)|eukprot:CAMPEP_0194048056 /NCGR_PEP_ID=MMETSP0009_2-20130614/26696_1 /TAXON_ID=210454 /ORGANISM="Grammatophora oceanica, Strain CCMP 410" /LENGTH=569 /DNA_ID=CAMNT_0038693855 /DNA_START=223 /DNA_END=1932 /DNA_ORIENTATION=-
MTNLTEDTYPAIVEFLGTFPSLMDAPPGSLAELSDGVALFEALAEIAPDYFDPSTIAHGIGDNWALKSSNFRKLIRNLEHFFHDGLQKDADFAALDIQAMAKRGDEAAIAALFELVAAAAVTCDHRSEFVGRIMTMSPENQLHMKSIIETSLRGLTEYDASGFMADDSDGDEIEMDFGDASDGGGDGGLWGGGAGAANTAELEQALADARRELAMQKSKAAMLSEDHTSSQSKLKVLVEDLQDRLQSRQDELATTERELKYTRTELDDSKARVMELEQQSTQLADDLDVANSKVGQLRKAEATVTSYRKKLESAGVMNQQLSEMEDQSATQLRKIMELEEEAKKVPALQKQVGELSSMLASMEASNDDAASGIKGSASTIADLRSKLSAAEGAKRMFEEELKDLRAQQEAAADDDDAAGGISLGGATTSPESKEKLMRLEIENSKLKEQLDAAKATNSSAAVASSKNLQSEVSRLKSELAAMEAEKGKLAGDKDKLETYTKRTLAKFQEKYLVALQECKSKLKEKQDKIEALENRSASEKTAQKREERLLSSTIYELGLSIMQNRLKER